MFLYLGVVKLIIVSVLIFIAICILRFQVGIMKQKRYHLAPNSRKLLIELVIVLKDVNLTITQKSTSYMQMTQDLCCWDICIINYYADCTGPCRNKLDF